jgi:hypothetical protein
MAFFAQAHWFDVANGTETCKRVQTSDLEPSLPSIDESVLYMASWTNTIVRAIHELDELTLPNWSFVDLGSGKGKVLIVADKHLANPHTPIIGVEHSPTLTRVARENLTKTNSTNRVLLRCEDATQGSWIPEHGGIGLYLYNPFSGNVLEKVLSRIRGRDVIVAYNNPVAEKFVAPSDWIPVKRTTGWHENLTVNYYASRSAAERLAEFDSPLASHRKIG